MSVVSEARVHCLLFELAVKGVRCNAQRHTCKISQCRTKVVFLGMYKADQKLGRRFVGQAEIIRTWNHPLIRASDR